MTVAALLSVAGQPGWCTEVWAAELLSRVGRWEKEGDRVVFEGRVHQSCICCYVV